MMPLGIVIANMSRDPLTQCTIVRILYLDIIVMSLLLNPPLVIGPGQSPRPLFFASRRRGVPRYVFDAA